MTLNAINSISRDNIEILDDRGRFRNLIYPPNKANVVVFRLVDPEVIDSIIIAIKLRSIKYRNPESGTQ